MISCFFLVYHDLGLLGQLTYSAAANNEIFSRFPPSVELRYITGKTNKKKLEVAVQAKAMGVRRDPMPFTGLKCRMRNPGCAIPFRHAQALA